MATQATDKPQTPYDMLGGRPVIDRIVNRFYDLMDTDPAYAELRALHAADLAPMRESLASFLSGWSGGPRDWFDSNPGKCMNSAHKHVTMSKQSGEQWADAMNRAIKDCGPENPKLGEAMAEVLGQLARSMGRD